MPRGGWEYTEESTGYRMTAMSLQDLMRQIEAHRRGNGLPLPSGWGVQVEMEICAQPKMAGHCGLPTPEAPKTRSLGLSDIGRFFRTVRNWGMREKLKLAPVEVVQERLAICAGCPNNVSVEKCTGCTGATRWMEELLPPERRQMAEVSGDGKPVRSCLVCGCWLPLKVQLPLGALEDEGLEFPDHCWIVRESTT